MSPMADVVTRIATTVQPSIFCAHRRRAGDAEEVCWETIEPANRQALGRVLILPGLTSPYHPKYLSLYRDLGQFIVAQGWQVAVFACRGQLGSGGLYSFPNAVADALAVLHAWDEVPQNPLPVGLLARSSGCPIALRVAQRRSDVRRLLLWGGSPRAVYSRLFGTGNDGPYMQACVDYGTHMARDFVATLFYPEDEIAGCELPVIWLGVGTQDEYTGPRDQVSILMNSKAGHSALHVIQNCPHGVSSTNPAWRPFRDMLGAWLAVDVGIPETMG
jgi:hypothetical protein